MNLKFTRILLLISVFFLITPVLGAQQDEFADVEDAEVSSEDNKSTSDDESNADTESEKDSEDNVESDSESDSDDLDFSWDDFGDEFGDDSDADDFSIEEIEESESDSEAEDELFVAEGVEWGGYFEGELDLRWSWDDYMTQPGGSVSDSYFVPEIDSYLWFNSRPEDDFRVFGKFSLEAGTGFTSNFEGLNLENLQLTDNGDGTFTVEPGTSDDSSDDETNSNSIFNGLSTSNGITFGVEEFFAEFDWEKKVFFRFGKSFVKWGVGYFFSPADIINLTGIDLDDPEESRQGPLSLRLQYPFGNHNFYCYLLTDSVTKPEQLAIAPRLELLAGNIEIGLGGYYKKYSAPRIMTTFSAPVGDVKFFGEFSLSWGSDRVFVRPSRIQPDEEENEAGELQQPYYALDTFEVDSKPFVSATIGLLYFIQDPDISFIFQYYFNGDGYNYMSLGNGQTLLDAAYSLIQNPDNNGLALPASQQGENYNSPPSLGFDDVLFFGRHYAALAFGWSNINDTKFKLNSYWIGNLSDNSGIFSVEAGYRIFNKIDISTGFRMTYGSTGTEFMDTAAIVSQNSSLNLQEAIFEYILELRIAVGGF